MDISINPIENFGKKRLFDMTGEELAQVIKDAMMRTKSVSEMQQPPSEYPGIPRFVAGIPKAARVLHVSESTIFRMKKSGEFDDCISQNGKTVIFDTHKMLERMRLSKQKGKYGQTRCNQEINNLWKKK